jgi:hypothetical protein
MDHKIETNKRAKMRRTFNTSLGDVNVSRVDAIVQLVLVISIIYDIQRIGLLNPTERKGPCASAWMDWGKRDGGPRVGFHNTQMLNQQFGAFRLFHDVEIALQARITTGVRKKSSRPLPGLGPPPTFADFNSAGTQLIPHVQDSVNAAMTEPLASDVPRKRTAEHLDDPPQPPTKKQKVFSQTM